MQLFRQADVLYWTFIVGLLDRDHDLLALLRGLAKNQLSLALCALHLLTHSVLFGGDLIVAERRSLMLERFFDFE